MLRTQQLRETCYENRVIQVHPCSIDEFSLYSVIHNTNFQRDHFRPIYGPSLDGLFWDRAADSALWTLYLKTLTCLPYLFNNIPICLNWRLLIYSFQPILHCYLSIRCNLTGFVYLFKRMRALSHRLHGQFYSFFHILYIGLMVARE
jgi:hypothetical protein